MRIQVRPGKPRSRNYRAIDALAIFSLRFWPLQNPVFQLVLQSRSASVQDFRFQETNIQTPCDPGTNATSDYRMIRLHNALAEPPV